jgi:hypothetical protein
MTEASRSIDRDLWNSARAVWSTVDVAVPTKLNKNNFTLIDDLVAARLTYQSAKEAAVADRNDGSDLDVIANQCRDLADTLTTIPARQASRLAGALSEPLDNILTDVTDNLARLESALRRSHKPVIRRKKTNEHLNTLVELLADVYERHTNKSAKIWTDRKTDERVGPIVQFVSAYNENFLSGELENLNARAIQRALQMRAKSSPPQ